MDTALFLTLFLFAVQTAAGVAPVKYPEKAWLADIIFWTSGLFALVCLVWWTASNPETFMAHVSPQRLIAVGLVICVTGLIWQVVRGPQTVTKAIVDTPSLPQHSIDPPKSTKFRSAKNKSDIADAMTDLLVLLNSAGDEISNGTHGIVNGWKLGNRLPNPNVETTDFLARQDKIEKQVRDFDWAIYGTQRAGQDGLYLRYKMYADDLDDVLQLKKDDRDANPILRLQDDLYDFKAGIAIIDKAKQYQDPGLILGIKGALGGTYKKLAVSEALFAAWIEQTKKRASFLQNSLSK